MVRQMVGDEVPLAWCGGNPDGGLGTNVEIDHARDRPGLVGQAGVAILVDLGGAETNSEMAIEMLPEERQGRVVVCNAPIVEGAVMAATEASGGASLDESSGPPRSCRPREAREMSGMTDSNASARFSSPIAVGLHARPSVKLTKLAKTFALAIEIGTAAEGPWIDAKSIVKVMAAKVPQGSHLHFRAAAPTRATRSRR